MSKQLITFLLCILLTTAAKEMVPLAQSNLWTQILTQGTAVGLNTYHNIYHPNMLGSGTFWLWTSPDLATTRTLTFEHTFYATCTGASTLQVTADQNFKAYLDGRLILSGNDWKSIYSADIKLNCGSHNLTIEATGGYSQYGSGVIFSLKQDQSECFNCGLNGFWDYDECKCKCLTVCGCASPQRWLGYPACSCRCPSATILSDPPTQAAYYFLLREQYPGELMDPSCPQGQYFDERTCSCRCLPRYCPFRWRWNGDPDVCKCQFTP